MNTIGYLEARSKIQALLGQSDLDLADVKEVIGRIDVGDGTGKTTVLYSGRVTPDGIRT